MRAADLRAISLFDGLTDDQLAELAEGGTEVRIEPGVELFHEGEQADFWWVLVDGAVDLLRHAGREDTVVGRLDAPGRWAGGFRAWDEHGVYLATARGAVAGRLLRVPAQVLRDNIHAWFPFGQHLIQGLYRTARTIESTARQRESLVSLGTLAAGFAHEINNPAAAASRAVDALDEACQTLLASLSRLARADLTAQQFTGLDALRREIGSAAAASPLALADQEDALSLWLARHDVTREWTIAPALAAAGADLAWCERAATTLPDAALEPGLEWVASVVSIAGLLAEMKESTRRISELVAAIKSYSQMDRASVQQVDVTDGIESALVMVGHKLRDGITIERAYAAGVPRIWAYPGELNQVWTGLIDNALDAMGSTTGTLRLATWAEPDIVVVEVADTGPGMPPEVAARAFDPFYTTKDAGQGTGLGLDIARRTVVERHGGSISIDSEPGNTVLRVRLPVRPPGISSRPDPG